MASETTTANPELLQEQVANLIFQPLEAACCRRASPDAVGRRSLKVLLRFTNELLRQSVIGLTRR